MLKKIKIENLALVDSVELEFDRGLSVLTGETGAGKSVIVTALSLALGGRADREYIRHGSDSCTIDAVFDISRMSPEYKKQYEDFLTAEELNICREISRDGNSKIRIKGKNSTLNQLKAVTYPVAEILGQHANQMLMDEDNHLNFLDNFAALHDIRHTVANAYFAWRRSASELSDITSRREQLARERELLLFQRNEIEKGQIRAGEEEELVREKKILDSARSLMSEASLVQDIIENEENSISTLISLAQKELDKMAAIDPTLEKKVKELSDISYQVEDLRTFIEQYGSSIEDDPGRIEEINLRLDEIYSLKKKYGGSEQSILDSLEIIRGKLSDGLPDVDSYIDQLSRKTQELFDTYSRHALALTDTRRKAADYLQKLVVKELKELAIDNGGFEFEFVYEDDPQGVIINGRAVRPSAGGLETGRILFSANPGEPLKSLVKTASGGEISRVLLALKSAEKKNNKLSHSLLVFDEVDAGIGGQTAVEVGKKLKRLSADNQLIVITHLHQIARESDHHYVAEKAAGMSKRAVIKVRLLDADGVEKELSRMVALPA